VRLRDLAGAIAEQLELGSPVVGEPDKLGWIALPLAADSPASAAITQRLTGWKPTCISLLEDVRGPAYKPSNSAHE
jgi:hypothetical protein